MDAATPQTIPELIVRLLTSANTYVVLAVLLAFLLRLIDMRMKKERSAIDEYKELIQIVKDERAAALARVQWLMSMLEKCQDDLNVAEAQIDVLQEQIDECVTEPEGAD